MDVKQFSLVLALMVLSMFVSCKPGVPDEYIQPGQLEDILFDYHLSQGILQAEGKGNEVDKQVYKLAVLKKYGVSEAEFDASMEYYMRHTERMHDVYEELTKRFENEALAQGASVSDLAQYGSMTAKGDTADIWAGDKSVVLSPYSPYHSVNFIIKADTAFHQGDRIMLNFDSQFIMQEGSRDGLALLAVTFSNDSVASQTRHIITNTHYSIQIEDKERLGIKSVKGYFLFNRGISNTTTTLKLLSLTNIQLIRMHMAQADSALVKRVGGPDARSSDMHLGDSVLKVQTANDSSRRKSLPPSRKPFTGTIPKDTKSNETNSSK